MKKYNILNLNNFEIFLFICSLVSAFPTFCFKKFILVKYLIFFLPSSVLTHFF